MKLAKLIIQKSQILSISLARKFDILPDNSTIDNQPLGVFLRWLVFYWDKQIEFILINDMINKLF